MPEFTFEKCKTKGACSAKLKLKEKLDLKKLKGNFEIQAETPVLFLIKEKDYEIVVHAYGEVLFKNGSNIDEMKAIASRIYALTLGKKV